MLFGHWEKVGGRTGFLLDFFFFFSLFHLTNRLWEICFSATGHEQSSVWRGLKASSESKVTCGVSAKIQSRLSSFLHS